MELLGLWLWQLLPANPLLVRTVQGGSRRTRHLWIRMGYLGVLVVVVTIRVLAGGLSLGQPVNLTELAKAGQSVFQWVAYGQVVLICLLAPLFMAGAIAAEQSGKTFNILLTTPLSNLQIILGLLLGRLFFVLALLASGLPLFAILQIFGGVRVSSVLVSFGVAALSAIMVGSVAITLAVLRIGGRKAVFIFVIVIAAYLVGAYAADHLLRSILQIGPGLTTWITPLHPLLVLESAISPDYVAPSPEAVAGHGTLIRFYLSHPFEAFAAITMLLSLLLVLWSAIRVRAVGQRVEGGPGAWRLFLGRLVSPGGPGQHKPREVRGNPIAWREAHTRGNRGLGVLARWTFAVLALAAAGADLYFYHIKKINFDDFTYVLIVLLMVELAVVVLVAVYMSAGSISREREDRSLDLLLTTPITPRQYLWGKLRGQVSFLSLLLAVPILTFLMLAIYTQVGLQAGWKQVMVSHAIPGAAGSIVYPLCIPESPVLLALVLVPFVAVCVAVGMQQSIKAKGVLSAVAYAVGILGIYTAFSGFLFYQAALNFPMIGPVFNAFSPATGFLMFLDPCEVAGFITEPVAGRISLSIAALIAAAVFGIIVYSLFWSMVQSFDQTVRKISGTA